MTTSRITHILDELTGKSIPTITITDCHGDHDCGITFPMARTTHNPIHATCELNPTHIVNALLHHLDALPMPRVLCVADFIASAVHALDTESMSQHKFDGDQIIVQSRANNNLLCVIRPGAQPPSHDFHAIIDTQAGSGCLALELDIENLVASATGVYLDLRMYPSRARRVSFDAPTPPPTVEFTAEDLGLADAFVFLPQEKK